MLIMSHIGYTVGIMSQIQKVIPNKRLNFWMIAVMSLLPDIIDRVLFVFILPFAQNGRLVAHTMLFGVIICIVLSTIRRHWWIYGLAPILHVILDTPLENPLSWIKHAIWPILGTNLRFLSIDFNHPSLNVPLTIRIPTRIASLSDAYLEAPWWYLSLELGGALVLIFLFLKKSSSHSQEKPWNLGKSWRTLLKSGNLTEK